MTTARLVVVGASAGGVEALQQLVGALPVDLPASVLVGLHLSPSAPSLLPQILARHSPVRVVAAEHGMELLPGQVVVAVPDSHLLVVDGHVVLGRGARENGHRPSLDALFRSAALHSGSGVVAAVLTGLLDDGSAGLRCVERYGGSCLVQDPAEADFPDMPRNALRAVPSARVVSLTDLAKEVSAAMTGPLGVQRDVPEEQRRLDQAELVSAMAESTRLGDGSVPGEPSPFACPDCHGVLHAIDDGTVLRYRCRTGHAWTAESLLAQQGTDVEEALWSAVRALEEKADLSGRLATRAEQAGHALLLGQWRAREEEALATAATLRRVLSQSPAVATAAAPDA